MKAELRRAGLWLSFEFHASAFGSWSHSGFASQSGPGIVPSNQKHGRAARGGFFSAAILWARLRGTGRFGAVCCAVSAAAGTCEESAGESGSRAMVSKGRCPCPLWWILPEAGAGRQRRSLLCGAGPGVLFPVVRACAERRARCGGSALRRNESVLCLGQAFGTVLLCVSHRKVVKQ